jgi:hypothetical protein
MCVVSNIGDSIGHVPWENPHKKTNPWETPPSPYKDDWWPYVKPNDIITIPEAPEMPSFDADSDLIRLQVKAVKEWLKKIDKILIAARDFDEATGQPDCETDEKMAKLKELADAFGVDMKFFS